jgi:hypothetical protein
MGISEQVGRPHRIVASCGPGSTNVDGKVFKAFVPLDDAEHSAAADHPLTPVAP